MVVGTDERSSYRVTERTKLKRRPQRGSYDRATIHAILDEGLVCQVGFALKGRPFVVPTVYARCDDRILLHGSTGSHMLRALVSGAEASVNVTLVDGLVLARSAFHHSVNYRSVILYATASEITGIEEKREALSVIVEHVSPGRWDEVRAPSTAELAMTTVVALPIEEVSAKVRTGPPLDDEDDYAWPVWAGVLPLTTVAGPPQPCPRLAPDVPVPTALHGYRRSPR